MNISSVTVKGQVTIPAAIRQQFSLDHGGEVIFSVEGDQIVIKPVHRSVEDASLDPNVLVRVLVDDPGQPEQVKLQGIKSGSRRTFL